MPQTIRKKAAVAKKQAMSIEVNSTARHSAFEMIQKTSSSVRLISSATGVSKSVVGRLKLAHERNDEKLLKKILSAVQKAGRKPVLSADEEEVLKREIKDASSRGFAIDIDKMRQIMFRIACDGRKGWKSAIQSDDAIRSFRTRNRDITYRKSENKEYAKLRAETYEHIKTFFDAMVMLEKKHPELRNAANLSEILTKQRSTALEASLGNHSHPHSRTTVVRKDRQEPTVSVST